MLSAFEIEGFRGIQSLVIPRLARINLFVGTNQSGKTSLLDALQIFLDGARPTTLFDCQARRDECFVVAHHDDGSVSVAPRLDSLFYGAKLEPGRKFVLAEPGGSRITLEVRAHPRAPIHQARIRPGGARASWAERLARLALRIALDEAPGVHVPVPFDVASLEAFLGGRDLAGQNAGDDVWHLSPSTTKFIGVDGLRAKELPTLWRDVPLTPREQEIVQGLREIEPRLEGISQISSEYPEAADEFVVKLAGFDSRFELGDMGEGFRRMFGLLLCLPDAGVTRLLIDEIDTGLHHSMLGSMWRTLLAAARRRDLQVFATTHSHDCVAALARLFEDDPSVADDLLVHRIERDVPRTTLYTAEEIDITVRHGIEVRG